MALNVSGKKDDLIDRLANCTVNAGNIQSQSPTGTVKNSNPDTNPSITATVVASVVECDTIQVPVHIQDENQNKKMKFNHHDTQLSLPVDMTI